MLENIFEENLSSKIPIPMCLVDNNGKIVGANDSISEVFLYNNIEGLDFFALTGIRISDESSENSYNVIERNDKTFKIVVTKEEGDEPSYLVIFNDVTNYENLKSMYNDERVSVCIINIDNYDELSASTSQEARMNISTELDRIIRQWASKVSGSINRLNSARYIMYFQSSYIESMIENKFAVLDEIREVETEADFPMSLSIGIGSSSKDLIACEESASAALDLALGRGGDQAVIKKGNKIEYYGGKSQTVEKSNKGKSRVVAHALKQLISQAKRVMIMGHKNPDMDCFGAALGIYRMCLMCGTDAYIVINEVSESLSAIYKQAKETGTYNFIDSKKSEQLTDSETLIVMVDTHRVSYVENSNLLTMTDRVVVIDHHRRAEDCVKSPTLNYVESYASSASELVSEILQYAAPKKTIVKLEAEALLGGISVDTNRFAVKTGVRTFEAAAWLRRSGADTTEVKRFFQENKEHFKVRANGIANARFLEDGVAVSICDGINHDAQIICAQVADELLTIKGVKASFVAGMVNEKIASISARSLGEVNVQVIMEKLGGGGHYTTAGAQLELSPEEVIEKVIEIVNK